MAARGVQVQRTPDGKVQAIVFAFPRKVATGAPTIGTGDKSLDFLIALEKQRKNRSEFRSLQNGGQRGP